MTGHKGYIGSHLKKYLEKNGFRIIPYEGDIMEFEIKNEYHIDLVIHLAALTGVRTSLRIPEEYWRINVDGFRMVMDECVKKKVKMMYASSSNAEEWWSNPYAMTKKCNEEMAKPHGFVGFRPHTVYPGREDMLYHNMINHPTRVRYINGRHARDWTHIDDLCSAVLTLMKKYDIIESNVIDIGTGESIKLTEVAKKLMPHHTPEIRMEDTEHERHHTKADTTTLKFFGWKPKHRII